MSEAGTILHEYVVKIKKQGNVIRTVRGIVAGSHEDAISCVEQLLGITEPKVHVDAETGAMSVYGWSGHEFAAREVV